MPSVLLDISSQLNDAYTGLRSSFALRSDSEVQRDSLALLSWDTGRFSEAAARLLGDGFWGPALASARLVNERVEYLLAVHEDERFARTFWNRSEGLSDESSEAPRNRSGEARGIVRRFAERRATPETSDRLLKSLIAKHDWESIAIHPSVVVAALDWNANEKPDGSEAETAATSVVSAAWFALAALTAIVEERVREADTRTARGLLTETGATLGWGSSES